RWQGAGVDEVGVVDGVSGESGPAAGSVIVRVDPRYFRPAEVDSLLGDAGKARERLGWTPKVTFEELVREMVDSDLELARRDDLCLEQGFPVFNRHECARTPSIVGRRCSWPGTAAWSVRPSCGRLSGPGMRTSSP